MKAAISFSPTFNAASKTLDFSGYSGFSIGALYAVINVKANQIIYAAGLSGYGYSSFSSGTVTLQYDTTTMSNSDELMVIYDVATNPVSVASLPLPTGAATETTLSSLNTKIPSSPATDRTTAAAPSAVRLTDGSAFYKPTTPSDTQPISASSLPLPTGASTAANQSTANSSLSSIDGKTPAINGYSATGAITTNSAACTLDVNGCSQATIQVAGSFSGLIALQGTVDGSVWQLLPIFDIGSRTAQLYVSTNDLATAPIGGWKQVRLFGVGTITGTATATLNIGIGTGIQQISSATAAQLYATVNVRDGSSNAISSTGGALDVNVKTDGSGGATAALQTSGNSSLSTLATNVPAKGQAAMSASMPVAIASDQTAVPVSQPDLIITGQATQTAVVNNIIPATASASATDVSGYRSGSVQVVSTGTGGTFIFEHSNDNVNFQPMSVHNAGLVIGGPITTTITATASQIVYSFPIRARYIRLRIATTITGGSIQAFTRISQESWSPAVTTVAQSVAGSLLATVNIAAAQTLATVTTVSSVTSAGLAVPGAISDVASAAITTTTTTAAFTPSASLGYTVNIPVTVVSGTTPTLDIQVQESLDSGTNWQAVYDFPRITATGFYSSPPLALRGNRIRYVQTVGGTTPSFTRAINRSQQQFSRPIFVQQVDRTIAPNTLNSNGPSLFAEGCTDFYISVRCTAQTTAATIALQGSDDGTNWFTTATTLTTVNGIAAAKVSNELWKFVRLTVTAAGTGITLDYAQIRAVGR